LISHLLFQVLLDFFFKTWANRDEGLASPMSQFLLFAYATSSETWERVGLIKMLKNYPKELSFLGCVDAHWMCFFDHSFLFHSKFK
jgi:hypothetical protein